VIEDWYERIEDAGLLDALAPYQPVVVGAYPLRVADDETPVEIVCRAVDLPAFARVVDRAYGQSDGFELHGGALDGEDAVFAEFALDGLRVEVAGQPEHVHRRLGAATLGIDRVLSEGGEVSRHRLRAAVTHGDDWLQAAMSQSGLTRAALESLSNANPAIVRRVMGVPQPAIPLRGYVVPVLIATAAYVLIFAAGAARGSQQYSGLMLLVEAGVLGALFGARIGLVAALVPLIPIGAWLLGPVLVGQSSCGVDCGQSVAGYLFVPVLVAGAAGLAGAMRDRYLPGTG
jgi:hypothetical protein